MDVYVASGVYQLKVEALLAVKCSAIALALKNSDIVHLDTGRGVLLARPVRK